MMKCFEWWRCSLLRACLFVVFGRTRFVKTAGKEEEEEEEEEEVEEEEEEEGKWTDRHRLFPTLKIEMHMKQ